jgi:hypothetical protein
MSMQIGGGHYSKKPGKERASFLECLQTAGGLAPKGLGGTCFTLNGNTLIGTMKGGELLARRPRAGAPGPSLCQVLAGWTSRVAR